MWADKRPQQQSAAPAQRPSTFSLQSVGGALWSLSQRALPTISNETLREQVVRVIAASPRGHLSVGKWGHLSYGADLMRMGQYQIVQVVGAVDDGTDEVLVRGRCRRVRLPRAVVLLPCDGPGVLLLAGARSGAVETVRGLVKKGVHISVVDEDFNTPLHLACIEARTDCACELLELGAIDHPLVTNVRYQTPGLLAQQRALFPVLRQLHASPASRALAQRTGQHLPLIMAAHLGDAEEVSRLLDEGVSVNATGEEQCTALAAAAEAGRLEVVRSLVGRGADVNISSGTTPYGETGCTLMPPTYMAVMNGHVEVLSELLTARADPNAASSMGVTAMHRAAALGQREMVQVLLNAHADVDAPTTRMTANQHFPGTTAVIFAAGAGHEEVVRMLLAHGADATTRCKSHVGTASWGTALHATCLSRNGGGIVRCLAQARADVNARMGVFSTARGVTPLMCAAVANNPEVLEALLAAGADASLRCSALLVGSLGWAGSALDLTKRWGRDAAKAALEAHAKGEGKMV